MGWKDSRLNSLLLSGVTKRMKGCGWQVELGFFTCGNYGKTRERTLSGNGSDILGKQ